MSGRAIITTAAVRATSLTLRQYGALIDGYRKRVSTRAPRSASPWAMSAARASTPPASLQWISWSTLGPQPDVRLTAERIFERSRCHFACWRPRSVGIGVGRTRDQGLENDQDIEAKRPVVNVVEVMSQPLIEIPGGVNRAAEAVDLCP